MYWRRSGYRGIGGKMLRSFLAFSLFIFSFSALACWKVNGTFAVDGETWKFDNKVEHNKEYIFPVGNYHVKLTFKPQNKKLVTLTYAVEERKDKKLVLITKGEEEDLKPGEQRDIFAKGEEGQPNSIITVNLTNI